MKIEQKIPWMIEKSAKKKKSDTGRRSIEKFLKRKYDIKKKKKRREP